MKIDEAWCKDAGVPDGIQHLHDLIKIVEYWINQGLGSVWLRGASALRGKEEVIISHIFSPGKRVS